MDIAATKIELTQHLLAIMDEKTLQRVVNFFKKEILIEEDEDFNAEELEELDRRRARCLSGDSTGYTIEESMELLRAAQRKEESASALTLTDRSK